MKKLLFILMTISFLTSCATLMQPTPDLDRSLEELLEQAEGAGYDSTMTGAEVQAELDRCAGRETTVGDPGSDAELVTEQAVREALNAKQGTLTNEAGLYSALSDVSNFTQPGTAETITANWINTDNPWVDNEIANDLTLDLLKLSVLTSAPGSPAAGRIYYADNATWDPCNIVGTDNYYCIYDGAAYIAIMDEDGNFFISSINVPTYEEDELNDNAGDRLLTLAEIRGPFLSNKGVGAAYHLDFPAHSSDDTWNVCLIKEEDQSFTVDPNGTEQWWFRNDNSAFSQLAAGENIVNTTNGRSMLCIKATEDGVYATGDANWAEETP